VTTHINANDFFRLPKTTDYLNLTVYQVRQWILYRQQETLDEQKAYRHITRALQDAITGKAIVTSSWVDALLHLLPPHYWPHLTLTNRYDRDEIRQWVLYRQQETLDEQKAYRHITRALQDVITGKAIVTSSWVDALLHLLPAHYWPHLTLTNRYDRGGCETCACSKSNPRGKLWSALLFDTEDVLAVWPPPAGRERQQREEDGGTDKRRPVVNYALRQPALRPAPDSMIHNTISKVYDEAEREDLKPPNVKEIVAPVQKRLSVQGYEASGRQIQRLADADKHKSRRRRPGPTVMSEKRRQLR